MKFWRRLFPRTTDNPALVGAIIRMHKRADAAQERDYSRRAVLRQLENKKHRTPKEQSRYEILQAIEKTGRTTAEMHRSLAEKLEQRFFR